MTAPANHPITLDTVVFTKCMVLAIPGHEPGERDEAKARPENNINLRRDPDQAGRFEARMTTVINPHRDKSAPYSVEVECMALLHTDDTLSEQEAYRGAMITAHSVLYGAIRETVAWLTSRQPYGTLMLGLSVLRSDASEDEAASPKQ